MNLSEYVVYLSILEKRNILGKNENISEKKLRKLEENGRKSVKKCGKKGSRVSLQTTNEYLMMISAPHKNSTGSKGPCGQHD